MNDEFRIMQNCAIGHIYEQLSSLGDHFSHIEREHGFQEKQKINPQSWMPEKIALMHSELSEWLEAERENPNKLCGKKFADGEILQLTCREEEIADILIRVLGTARRLGVDVDRAVYEKSRYNGQRPYKHGKKF